MIKFDKKTDKIAFIAPASSCSSNSGKLSIEKSKKRLLDTIKLSTKSIICSKFSDIFDMTIVNFELGKSSFIFFIIGSVKITSPSLSSLITAILG